ncbi:MAG: hypothetical protein ACP5KN_00500 [Armatimonadota bacterium]
MSRRLQALTAVVALMAWAEAEAAPEVHQVAAPMPAEVTLYTGTSDALVRQHVMATLREGENVLAFSWSSDNLDAGSVRLHAAEGLSPGEIVRPSGDSKALRWTVTARKAGEYPVTVSHLIKGISWSPTYRMTWPHEAEEALLEGYVTITNGSGVKLDPIKAQIVLGRPGMTATEPPQPTFPIMGVEMLPQGSAVRAGFLPPMSLSARLLYRIDSERAPDRVERILVVEPPQSNGLEREALPKGPLTVAVEEAGEDLWELVRGELSYAAGEPIELPLGAERDILVERKLLERSKVHLEFDRLGCVSGFDTVERYELRVSNHTDRAAQLEVVETVLDTWDFETEALYVTEEGQVVMRLEVAPADESVLQFTLIKHSGTRI